MIQNWKKHGLIYSGRAQIPTVWVVDDKTWRIYFADRTADNKSYTRYLDVEAGNPKNIIYEHKESILAFGKLGSFDREGIMPSWLIKVDDVLRLYYIGWTQRKDVPFQNSIGLALSYDNGKTFSKYGAGHNFNDGLILSTDAHEPYFTGTSCVIKDGNLYRLYYLSCTEWVEGARPEPRYNLKQRYSENGIIWSKFPSVIIDYKSPTEGGICRASVISESGVGRMWYCYRGLDGYRNSKNDSYRIGYAETVNRGDLTRWTRKDELVDLSLSADGFDSQMLAYPFILKHENKLFMFYNGDGFGASGLGYATLDLIK